MEMGDIVLQKYCVLSGDFSRTKYNCLIVVVHPAILCDNPSKIFGAFLFRAPVTFLLT